MEMRRNETVVKKKKYNNILYTHVIILFFYLVPLDWLFELHLESSLITAV